MRPCVCVCVVGGRSDSVCHNGVIESNLRFARGWALTNDETRPTLRLIRPCRPHCFCVPLTNAVHDLRIYYRLRNSIVSWPIFAVLKFAFIGGSETRDPHSWRLPAGGTCQCTCRLGRAFACVCVPASTFGLT